MPRQEFTEGAPELVAWCVGQTVGSITVLDAWFCRDGASNGEPMVVLTLILTDPPTGSVSWRGDDAFALRMMVHEKARELLTADRWHIRFLPATPWLARRAAEVG